MSFVHPKFRLVHGSGTPVRQPPVQSLPLSKEDAHRALTVRQILHERQRRAEFFGKELFAEPAWDMLLELYASELEQRRVAITVLCSASGVPATTALRWINALEHRGLIARRPDPTDGRRVYISLSRAGSEAVAAYFQDMRSN